MINGVEIFIIWDTGINWTVRDAQNSVDKNVHIKYGFHRG